MSPVNILLTEPNTKSKQCDDLLDNDTDDNVAVTSNKNGLEQQNNNIVKGHKLSKDYPSSQLTSESFYSLSLDINKITDKMNDTADLVHIED